MSHPSTWPRSLALLVSIAVLAPACSGDDSDGVESVDGGSGGDDGDGGGTAEPVFAILSAFPAEMAAVLDLASVEETKTIDGHTFRAGMIGPNRVVIGMTGIGLVNAAATTRILLDGFDVAGVVVSGVAGSPQHVGDVTVPATWVLDGGDRYDTHGPWLDLAKGMVEDGKARLENCAIIPDAVPIAGVPEGTEVCFPHESRVVAGGFGDSTDPFGGKAFACVPGGNDVYGCDTEAPIPLRGVSVGPEAEAALAVVDPDLQTAYDQETAAIAAAVAERKLPFVAFRAASDGGGDPYGLSGVTQFFAYYRLAAHNAAAAAATFVERLRDSP